MSSTRPRTTAPTAPGWPVWCTDLELSGALPGTLPVPPEAGARAADVLLRLHGAAVGSVRTAVTGPQLDVAALLDRAERDDGRLAARLAEHLAEHAEADVAAADSAAGDAGSGAPAAVRVPRPGGEPLPAAGPDCPLAASGGPAVTVAVCTRDRAEALRACLHHLQRLDYPRLEVLVVDNAPRDGSTRAAFDAEVGADTRFRYVHEPVPGLSRARNRALAEATGELIAYTDDDVRVDPLWVRGLVRGLRRHPRAGCVTGPVRTAEIRGGAELYFDGRVGWSGSCEPRVFHADLAGPQGPLFPYEPGRFGTGANFAARTGLLRSLGGFDESLGAGSATAGGEDLDAFVRVIQAGAALVHEPGALVWHHHRADVAALRRQSFAYGLGLSAFLTKHLVDPRTRRAVLARVGPGLRRLAGLARPPAVPPPDPAPAVPPDPAASAPGPVPAAGLVGRELLGVAAGPFAYLRSRRTVRRRAARPLVGAGSQGGAR